ncbi:MBL fold metallo-hydrolase [Leptolyngbyaceae cyanobacterium CCMR0082]|uniref:MBL fold metallo-hydrolase n=1 Tax=Adonisia turfae CCMR0082 TaxID=2304604 RepID=A0A6M0S181_9CYAN|nr:MBL fold metallo-hydrolase [Adonisia turfae CCMR0082]
MSTSTINLDNSPTTSETARSNTKLPRSVFGADTNVYAFPPNRETLGGTAYLITYAPTPDSNSVARSNILVDCPALTDTNLNFIAEQGGLQWLVITHRGGSSHVRDWQSQFGCDVVLQEQEAYLLPQIETRTFHHALTLTPRHKLLWTPGHSPGSVCLYNADQGGILFSGRHVLPTRQGGATPLRVSKTFHWPRQLKHVQRLLDKFTPQTLSYICPGANIGFLRGKQFIDDAYNKLAGLDLQELAKSQVLL